MGIFQDAVNNAMGVWFGDIADTITYNGEDIPAHIDYGDVDSEESNASRATVIVRVADVSDPQYRDPVIINGITWRVYRDENQGIIITGDGYTWQIPIERDVRPTFHR